MVNLKSKIRNHHLPNIPFLEDPSASFPGHVPLPLRPWQQSAWSDTWKWRRWRWTYFCYQVGVWKWGCTCTLISFFSSDRRKFRSKTSDNMERWKSRGGKSQRWEEKKNEDQRRERVRRKKMQVREKVENSRFIAFFPNDSCGSGRSLSRLANAAGAAPSGQMRDEKLRCIVARSTFPSQNAQSTHCRPGPLLEVDMSKKCTTSWCEARFHVKMWKAHAWTIFQGSDVVLCGRPLCLAKSEPNVRVFMLFLAVTTTTTITLHYTTLHYTTLQPQLQLQLRYSPLHDGILHYTNPRTLH